MKTFKQKQKRDLYKKESGLKAICDECIFYTKGNKKCWSCEYNAHRVCVNRLRGLKW